ncbi:MAG: DUF4435 domain-containing protein [Oscillochloridaceae bacterium]|nr:DUF4435 domain-containing protein [Oscillochloridaceae bacterium]
MKGFPSRTSGDVVSEILMTQTASKSSILVVEGEDDAQFWKTRAALDKKRIVIAGGKQNLVGALVDIEKRKKKGILGIVDDDCDSLFGRAIPSAHIVRTETRDLETLLLSTRAFEKVLAEVGDDTKIEALEQREGRSIRNAFIARALVFGKLRYLSAERNWTVNFAKDFSPWRFADIPSWTFDETRLLQAYVQHVPGVTVQDVQERLACIDVRNPWLILHGKDSLEVLAIGLRECIGQRQIKGEELFRMLRLAFDDALFRDTRLYQAVRQWEQAHPPYQILRHNEVQG